MPRPRVIFVNRFYWPDQPATAQLLTDLAEALVQRGPIVTVVTTGQTGMPTKERHGNVEIERVAFRQPGPATPLRKVRSFVAFIRRSRRWLKTELQSGDVVVSMTDPPLLSAALDRTVRRAGAQHVHWIQDIFPEVAVSVFGFSLLNVFRPWRDRVWKRAAFCVVPGNAMGGFVESRGVLPRKISVIPNWSPDGLRPSTAAALDWRTRFALQDKFVVMYSGNLGRVHDFSAIVPLARELEKNARVQFVFIGNGPERARLEKRISDAQLRNVQFLPPVHRSELSDALSAADLHLVTLRRGCEALVFPSKLYGIAAVGRPALVLGPKGCEPAALIKQYQWGASFGPEEIAASAQFIRHLENDPAENLRLRENALAFAQSGGLNAAVQHWAVLLESLFRSAALASGPSTPDPSTAKVSRTLP